MTRTTGNRSRFSVVIATRNRGDLVVQSIEAVVDQCHAQSAEVIIIDQSDDERTAEAVFPFIELHQVRYLRSPSTGLGMARNEGMAAARSPWVAFTDDDCVAAPDWLEALEQALSAHEHVSVVFGNVNQAPHDPEAGFIPNYIRRGTCLVSSVKEKNRVEGIGACMAVRKSAWEALGGFDPMLGAGSPFHAAEELDFVVRSLVEQHSVYETDRASVTHSGFRANDMKSQLAFDYSFGIGAAYAKLLRCRQWQVLIPLMQLGLRWAIREPRVNYGTPPSRLSRLRGFLHGAAAGWRAPLDRARMLYLPPTGPGSC